MSQMQQFGDMCMGKERAKRFMCTGCKERRDRFRKHLAVTIVVVGLMASFGVMAIAMWYLSEGSI